MSEPFGPECFGGSDYPPEARCNCAPLIKPGDIVTTADAPEGAPTWVGCLTTYGTAYYQVRVLGLGDCLTRRSVRRITDAEAIALVEALTWEQWRPDRWNGGYSWGDGHTQKWMGANSNGRWECGPSAEAGYVGDSCAAMAVASRAFLRWMCGGERG